MAMAGHAQNKITVAVAANMQYTMDALKVEFKKTDSTEIEVVLGASGQLTQQIMQGAPFDIFVSADTDYPAKLAASNFAAARPEIYTRGVLVLWSVKPGVQLDPTLKNLVSENIQHIAIANPTTAPYGKAAKALMEKYNIYDKIKSKIVTGESITQASQFIATSAADIGFTAKSIVISNQMKGIGHWIELKEEDYPAILQAAVLLKYGQENRARESKKFYDFLVSPPAKEIYKKFGYLAK